LKTASIGSGVYYSDGKSFRNYTTKQGLANNEVTCIYEDKSGTIWFGTQGGVSRYDGKSFRNYTTREGLPSNDVNSIIEDKTGKFWFGTRGYACIYDGKTFTILTNFAFSIFNNKDGTHFMNVRSIIEDKKGNIWLGGIDGLWRYDGSTFTNFTQNFVGNIYEDKKGNIWTSSQSANDKRWALSRYDEKSLSNKKPTVTEIKSEYEDNKGMIFGILEAYDGSIWFGALDGVHRYDGNTITDFKGKEIQE
jgi:ligand-binding sensor domain-containing protein